MNTDFIFKEESYAIIGCCMEVHRELGHGFLEAVYQEALEMEFDMQGVPHEREKKLNLQYKGKPLKKKYYADFVCFNEIIVEVKAIESLAPDHIGQVLNYLKGTGFRLGLLINFGTQSLQYKRIIL